MPDTALTTHTSPWRKIFENVRSATGSKRDQHGILGSINWLRKHMELRGANPNVVRNIIYRDKGKLDDKRALFAILDELWQGCGNDKLSAPELEALLSSSAGSEVELMQLLGREKMQAYRRFTAGIRNGTDTRILLTGKAGSGKTLLVDTVQQALVNMPEAKDRIIRLEFCSADLVPTLYRFARELKMDNGALEARLIKLGASTAFAVQADAQADVARLLENAIRQRPLPVILLVHVSQTLGTAEELAGVPLRLNTPEVPRVRAGEWLWHTLLEPLSRTPGVNLLVSLTELSARMLQQPGNFDPPVKLNPPTVTEARRFVRARLPQLSPAQQESLIKSSGRSFEELRTLTLLAEMREPIERETAGELQHLRQLGRLIETSSDSRLREFLSAVTVLSAPEFMSFPGKLLSLLRTDESPLSSLEQAFLDPMPARPDQYRIFSRQLARGLREYMQTSVPELYRELNLKAADWYRGSALAEPRSEEAVRYLHHLFEARQWLPLEQWMRRTSVPQSLLLRIWRAARQELVEGDEFERIALRIATHYVRLGSFNHPDVLEAFEPLSRSHHRHVRAWTTLKRAEGAALRGQFELAESFISDWTPAEDPLLDAEAALVKASIARWRGQLTEAARLVSEEARPLLPKVDDSGANSQLLHAKVAIWAGLVAKDQGDMHRALHEFSSVIPSEDLVEARVAYQQGDVLLRLGRFDAALQQLNNGVELARRSEALVSEQTRFLSRRGMLHGMRGDLELAALDFKAARSRLEEAGGDEAQSVLPGGSLERDFWLARSDEDNSLVLLAAGRFQEAIFLLTDSLQTFSHYGATFGVDTGPRILRSSLYLALAYCSRGLQQPFRFPLTQDPRNAIYPADLEHARHLLDRVRVRAEELGGPTLDTMRRDCLLLESLLLTDSAAAVATAESALALARSSYDQAQGSAYVAMAHWRNSDHPAALASARAGMKDLLKLTGPDERSDEGLRAWLLSLSICALVGLGKVEEAGLKLKRTLADAGLSPHHQVILRSFGDAVEAVGERTSLPDDLLPLDGSVAREMRLPDELVANWLVNNRQA